MQVTEHMKQNSGWSVRENTDMDVMIYEPYQVAMNVYFFRLGPVKKNVIELL